MCILAGYVGHQQAAPVLMDMLRREQGLGGGYMTGIATVANGRLYCEKVVGDLDVLLRETPALTMRGHVGIIHSRGEGTGGRQWAHPFVNDGPDLAYVANGNTALLGRSPDYGSVAKSCFEAGHRFLSLDETPARGPAEWRDDLHINASEVMCHCVSAHYDESGDLAQALAAAVADLPSEIAALAVQAQHSGSLAAIRTNMPLFLGQDDSGTYAATTALAFPEAVTWTAPVPPNCAATVRGKALELWPVPRIAVPVAPLPSAVDINETVVAALRRGEPLDIPQLMEATEPLWSQETAPQRGMLVFELLQSLVREGKVRLQEVRIARRNGDGTAPRALAQWVA